jgi:hypothetical protein
LMYFLLSVIIMGGNIKIVFSFLGMFFINNVVIFLYFFYLIFYSNLIVVVLFVRKRAVI